MLRIDTQGRTRPFVYGGFILRGAKKFFGAPPRQFCAPPSQNPFSEKILIPFQRCSGKLFDHMVQTEIT